MEKTYSFKQLMEHHQYLTDKKNEIVSMLSIPKLTDEVKLSYVFDLNLVQFEINKLETTVMASYYKITKLNL